MSSRADEEPASGPGPWDVVKAIASVIAPATLITGLMYYFGLIHAYRFFGGFGVDYTLFDLSTEDYVLRSADGLIVPFGVVALAVLVLAWASQLLTPPVERTSAVRLVRIATPVCSVFGLGLMIVAVVALLLPDRFRTYPYVGGLALLFGVLLLTGATRSLRWLAERRGHSSHPPSTSWAVAEWAAVIVLVSVGLFWAVGNWSSSVAEERVEDVVRALPAWPSAIVYSERSLSLDVAGVTETKCSGEDAAFGYRYDGLVLITHEGGQLLLLPRTWTSTDGTATVLTKTDSVRLDFRPAEAVHAPSC